MIKSAENLEVGDIFKIGNTPIIVSEVHKSLEHRATHIQISLMSLYSDGGRDLNGTLVLPKIFLVELFETESQ